MTIDASTIEAVVDAEQVGALADRLSEVASLAKNTLDEAHAHWGSLSAYFRVTGANGAYAMIDRPRIDGGEFHDALSEAATLLHSAAEDLSALRRQREDLLERVAHVNRSHLSALGMVAELEASAAFSFDPAIPA